MQKAIYFDMDGTIADLYSVDNWLNKLRSFDPSPYADARPLVPMNALAHALNILKKRGFRVGVVSWLPRNSTPAYDEAVTRVKMRWLHKHLKSVQFDEIAIVPYGTPKHHVVQYNEGFLFDDEWGNRDAWKGVAYSEQKILEKLKKLSKNA